jgi:hypothetical protein
MTEEPGETVKVTGCPNAESQGRACQDTAGQNSATSTSACKGKDVKVATVANVKLQYTHWPIVDRSVPTFAAMHAMLTDLEARIARGAAMSYNRLTSLNDRF